jgi:DNA-binding response OmpR family regulator
MKSTTRVLAASHDSAFLHLIQTLLDDIGIPVRTTSNWQKVPGLAAKLLPDLAILDLVPGSEMSCWLTAEALRCQATTRNIRILLCPVAWWLTDEHREQMDRLAASVWSGTFELEELLRLVVAALPDTHPTGR